MGSFKKLRDLGIISLSVLASQIVTFKHSPCFKYKNRPFKIIASKDINAKNLLDTNRTAIIDGMWIRASRQMPEICDLLGDSV